jgi:hypothetical protein
MKTSFESSANSLISDIYTLDTAYKKLGGYGTAQIISIINCAVIRNSGNAFFNVFAMLSLEQRYLCQETILGSWDECSAEEIICPALEKNQQITYKVDTGYEYYIDAWYN